MKLHRNFRKCLLVAMSALALGGSGLMAQPADQQTKNPDSSNPGGRRPFRAGGPQEGGFRPGAGGALFPLMERILTDEQRESLRAALEGQREQLRELEGKIREARRDLMKASLTGKFDEDAVRAQALAAAKLEAELTVLRAKAFAQMKPALSPEQLEQLKARPPFGDNPQGRESRPGRRAPDNRDANDLPPKPQADK